MTLGFFSTKDFNCRGLIEAVLNDYLPLMNKFLCCNCVSGDKWAIDWIDNWNDSTEDLGTSNFIAKKIIDIDFENDNYSYFLESLVKECDVILIFADQMSDPLNTLMTYLSQNNKTIISYIAKQ